MEMIKSLSNKANSISSAHNNEFSIFCFDILLKYIRFNHSTRYEIEKRYSIRGLSRV